ncbi:DUF998 domain-containing protein [Candidatus Micrarchaeota archaeon]|nr:DUF998 domain-containing protein [Candidatus Micrarchaeota archaeon]
MIWSIILGIIFAYSLSRVVREARSKFGAGILLLSTISLIFVGVFTENEGTLHYIFSVGFFFLSAIGIAVVGLELRDLSSKVYALVVILFGLTTLPILEHIAVLLFGVGCIECVLKIEEYN